MLGDFEEMWEEWVNSHPEDVKDESVKQRCCAVYSKMHSAMKLREKYELRNEAIEEIYRLLDDPYVAMDIRRRYGGLCTVAETLDFLVCITGPMAKDVPQCIRDLNSALSTARELAQEAREVYAKALDAMYQDGEDRVRLARYDTSELDDSIRKYREFLEEDE